MFESDITINGKHATYMKFLVNHAKLFARYFDVYVNAAILGYLYGKKSQKDSESTDRARIYADVLIKEKKQIEYIYRLIMLLDDEIISKDERINRAFRWDAYNNGKELEQNIKLFNDYVFGGIEILYEDYCSDCTMEEDYIDKAYDVVKKFDEDLSELTCNEEIERLTSI